LDSRSGLRHGGDSGPVIVPGKSPESLLLKALRWDALEMPPAGKLPQETIDAIGHWISIGAPDPRTGVAASTTNPAMSIEEGRDFWSFRPPKNGKSPHVRAAASAFNTIDRFIHKRLEERGLEPGPQADRYVLLRRLSFDLVGLPPTYEQMERFLADESPDAYARLIDGLLASPALGERWGRYWLDVARYADTGAQNRRFSYAFGYRNWVIVPPCLARPTSRRTLTTGSTSSLAGFSA
jgi:hypothetical protein